MGDATEIDIFLVLLDLMPISKEDKELLVEALKWKARTPTLTGHKSYLAGKCNHVDEFRIPKTNYYPGDLDGVMERNGNAVFFEGKLPENVLHRGQTVMFNRMTSGKNAHNIALTYQYSEATGVTNWVLYSGGKQYKLLCTYKKFISMWFEWANNGRNKKTLIDYYNWTDKLCLIT